ncbi:hypothetical protein HK104_007771, partial [Borealophlyctis nickersoniae]
MVLKGMRPPQLNEEPPIELKTIASSDEMMNPTDPTADHGNVAVPQGRTAKHIYLAMDESLTSVNAMKVTLASMVLDGDTLTVLRVVEDKDDEHP